MNKRVLRVHLEDSIGLKQLGLTNIAKALPVTDDSTIESIETQLLKQLKKGLTEEKCRDLEAELEGYTFAQRNSDGKTVRRYALHEMLGSDSPKALYYLPPKKKKRVTLKSGSMQQLIKGNKNKEEKRQTMTFSKVSPLSGRGTVSAGNSGSPNNRPASSPRGPRESPSSGRAPTSTISFTKTLSNPAIDPFSSSTNTPNSAASPLRDSKPSAKPSVPAPTEDEVLLHDMLRHTLNCMGLSREGIDTIISQAAHSSWQRNGRATPPWYVCETLDKIRLTVVEPGLERLSEIRRIVDAQRWFRTCLHMKRWRQYRVDFLPAGPGQPLPPLGVRLGLFRKMRSTEISFRKKLYYIFTKIEPPMKDLGEKEWETGRECELLFSQGNQLRNFSARFLKKIDQLVEGWPGFNWVQLAEGISDFYLENSQTLLNFALKYRHMQIAYEVIMSRPDAKTFVQDLVASEGTRAVYGVSNKKRQLWDLVVEPLERVQYYRTMFGKFLATTPEEKEEERNALAEAEKKFANLFEQIEQNKLESVNNVRQMEVRRNCDKVVGLDVGRYKSLSPVEDRAFIGETGGVSILVKEKEKWKAKDVVFLLFSDLGVVATKLDKTVARPEKSLMLEENGVVPLSLTTVTTPYDIGDPKHPAAGLVKLVIETGKDTYHEIVLDFSKSTTHLGSGGDGGWCKKILSGMKANRKCFGKKLSEVVDHDKAKIPHIVTTTIEALWKKRAQLLEGIFRIAGEMQYLVQMKAMFDRWTPEGSAVDLDGFEPFDIASLLKQWFRELPEPVMTYKIYEKYVMDGEVNDNTDWDAVLNELPALNREVILFVMGFNVELTKHSESNKMTPANVAICWGPTIMRPRNETMSTSMLIPKVNQFVEKLVTFLASSPSLLPPPPASAKTAPPPAPFRNSSTILNTSASTSSLPTINHFRSTTNASPTPTSNSPISGRRVLPTPEPTPSSPATSPRGSMKAPPALPPKRRPPPATPSSPATSPRNSYSPAAASSSSPSPSSPALGRSLSYRQGSSALPSPAKPSSPKFTPKPSSPSSAPSSSPRPASSLSSSSPSTTSPTSPKPSSPKFIPKPSSPKFSLKPTPKPSSPSSTPSSSPRPVSSLSSSSPSTTSRPSATATATGSGSTTPLRFAKPAPPGGARPRPPRK